MKSSISRQHIYVLVLSLTLFIFVLLFSFLLLIPQGKEYRVKRIELKKAYKELREYENFHDETLATLKELKSTNRRIISAFERTFNPDRFEKLHKKHFSSFHISKVSFENFQEEFAVYEVNTSSHINSPQSFYEFLENVNKSDWIVGVNFPIDFKRDGELIRSSFTMKVYANKRDTNATASASSKK